MSLKRLTRLPYEVLLLDQVLVHNVNLQYSEIRPYQEVRKKLVVPEL